MSIFKVKLHNQVQGKLDMLVNGVSIQRDVWVTGPNRVNRKLKDGEIFEDCNYWKQYAYPQVGYDQAFIEVLQDDGSIWDEETNTSSNFAKSYTLTGLAGSTFADNTADIFKDTIGSYACYTRITNKGEAGFVTLRLNGVATMTLSGGAEIIFDMGDMPITKIEVDNSTSGAIDSPIEIILLIKSKINS